MPFLQAFLHYVEQEVPLRLPGVRLYKQIESRAVREDEFRSEMSILRGKKERREKIKNGTDAFGNTGTEMVKNMID